MTKKQIGPLLAQCLERKTVWVEGTAYVMRDADGEFVQIGTTGFDEAAVENYLAHLGHPSLYSEGETQ